MFNWTDNYSLGVVSIDEQHQRLVAMGKELQELVETREGDDIYDELISMLDGLKEYTKYHFDYEEEIMERLGFDGLEEHKKQHSDFIDKLESIDFDSVDEDQSTFAKDLLRVVSVWIFKHIVGTDAKYKSAFIEAGIQ